MDHMFDLLPKIAWYRDYVSYEKGYEFLSYSKAGRVEDMWDFLHNVFGDWLEQGHTRFPENLMYQTDKNKQLVFYNHHYTLQPDLLDLEWANIRFPVKEGFITLKLRKEGFDEIEIPSGCTVEYIRKGQTLKLKKQGAYSFKINSTK